MDITESLKEQLVLMEAKKQELERAIGCIKSVLTRTNEEPDWNSVAEIARTIQMDQGADERHFRALKHTADNVDWYVKIYQSLHVKENDTILDLGCGFGKLWRNNWTDIPTNATVDGYDLHGSWADNLDEYIRDNKETLSKGADISIQWKDVEEEETWNEMKEKIASGQKGAYTIVVAHYLLEFLKDRQLLIERVADVLAEGGMFSCSGYNVAKEDDFWKKIFENMKLSTDFVSKEIAEKQEKHDAFHNLLESYFVTVESVKLTNRMQYDSAEELFERLCYRYPAKKKYFADKETIIKGYFEQVIEEQGKIVIETDSQFWHCFK